MPPLEEMDRNQDAVLWPFRGEDANGMPVVGQPVQLRVRWVDGVKSGTDPKGNPIAILAQVVVDRDVPINSVMCKGLVSSLPVPDAQLRRVIGFQSADSLKGEATRREVTLAKGGKLPQIV